MKPDKNLQIFENRQIIEDNNLQITLPPSENIYISTA